ncbi:hypothetical protein B296_00052033, partial [Ensete ventricosum]
ISYLEDPVQRRASPIAVAALGVTRGARLRRGNRANTWKASVVRGGVIALIIPLRPSIARDCSRRRRGRQMPAPGALINKSVTLPQKALTLVLLCSKLPG